MGTFITPSGNKKLHPAFHGLNERQVALMYKDNQVRQLQPGETLFLEGDDDNVIFLILNGTLQIQQSLNEVNYPLAEVESHGQVSQHMFAANGKRTASAIAKEPVSVLTISESSLAAIDRDTQATLFKNLQNELSLEASLLRNTYVDAQFKNDHLSRQMNDLLAGRSSQYGSSAAIRSMLKRVPKLPPFASQLSGMLLADDVSAKDMTELAKLDPSLTGAVLKTVNSSYYGLSQKVNDFQHAALLLGFNQIYQIILKLGIQKTMPDTGPFKRLQTHSVLISILAFEISLATGQCKAPVMNTMGLLHDIGKSVLLLMMSQNPKLTFFISLLDPARIGALLLETWEIPVDIYGPLEFQNYPEFLPPEMIPEHVRKQVAILHLAHLCLDSAIGKKSKEQSTVFQQDYFKELGILETSVGEFIRARLSTPIKKRAATYPQQVREIFSEMLASHSVEPEKGDGGINF